MLQPPTTEKKPKVTDIRSLVRITFLAAGKELAVIAT
jgi:hypothetical protein